MIGKNKDTEFKIENYKDFYEHHRFVPTPEAECFSIHELIPRFGWGFDKIEELAPANVLDLGCLDGAFVLSVAKNLGVHCTGVDLTEDGINLAKERAEQYGVDAEFYQGSVEEHLEAFAKAGRKFDVITWFEIIEHVEDVQKVIKLIDAVLAPGGHVLVSTPSFESPIYGANDEKNKCHIRLYTLEKEDYEAANKYGNVRKATSIYKEIGEDRILEAEVINELINLMYQ